MKQLQYPLSLRMTLFTIAVLDITVAIVAWFNWDIRNLYVWYTVAGGGSIGGCLLVLLAIVTFAPPHAVDHAVAQLCIQFITILSLPLLSFPLAVATLILLKKHRTALLELTQLPTLKRK